MRIVDGERDGIKPGLFDRFEFKKRGKGVKGSRGGKSGELMERLGATDDLDELGQRRSLIGFELELIDETSDDFVSLDRRVKRVRVFGSGAFKDECRLLRRAKGLTERL